MTNFELIVLSIQKKFGGSIVDNWPAKGAKINEAPFESISEGSYSVNSPPVGGLIKIGELKSAANRNSRNRTKEQKGNHEVGDTLF